MRNGGHFARGDELKRQCFRGKPACFHRQPCSRSRIVTASQLRSFTYVFTRTPYWASSTARARLMALIAPCKVNNICMKISLFAWWHPVNSPHKVQWRGAIIFSLICVWINGWVNNREAGDLRRYRTHYDVTVITQYGIILQNMSHTHWLQ